MRIRYRRLPDLIDPAQFNHYPYLRIAVRHTNITQPFLALVDSGAIDTLFPAVVAEVIGIDLESGVRKVYFGIGGHAAIGYVHECQLQVQGFNPWNKVKIGFVDTIKIPLLGQSGFFENYQVIFEDSSTRSRYIRKLMH